MKAEIRNRKQGFGDILHSPRVYTVGWDGSVLNEEDIARLTEYIRYQIKTRVKPIVAVVLES